MIRIRQLKIEVTKNSDATLKSYILKKLNIKELELKNYNIKRQSLDARDKSKIFYVYEVDVEVSDEDKVLKKVKSKDIFTVIEQPFIFPKAKNTNIRPVIVGSGPAGLFAAYTYVQAGLKPLILERGERLEDRVKTVEAFWQNNTLNSNSNVQFGEGGAGTFSDGKLNTLVKDIGGYGTCVLKTFVEFGAPPEILYSYKPHIGTNILRSVIANMRDFIISKGGIIRYNSCLTDLIIKDNKLEGIIINGKEKLACDTLVLAIGHSARDTFLMLHQKNLSMQSKPFAVGLRIEHSQDAITESQYGLKYKDLLGPATYKLTHQSSNGHGVYSFCMCPGGYVVNASSEENRLAINGMSNHERDSKNANSALVITVNESIYGSSLFAGIDFQRKLEEKAYQLGSGKIPIQLVRDYLNNTPTTKLGTIESITKGQTHFANLNDLLPNELNIALKEALEVFGNKIEAFKNQDAILSGIESRTSSPIKILRDSNFSSNIVGVYPCGEGAGYAGGITTSAIDGIKVAEATIKNREL